MTELLNGRRFEGRAAGKGAAPPRTALQRSGDIASRYPILRSSFGPNLDQIGRKTAKLWHFLRFLEVPPEGLPEGHFRFADRRHLFVLKYLYLEESPHKISDL